MAPPSVGIIGGGVSGLMCATRLRELGLAPIVFDTGKRNVGGRASSRRLGFKGVDGERVSLTVDHAAQFFLSQRAPFASYVKRWAEAGLVARWTEPVAVLSPGASFRTLPTPETNSPLCRWVAAGSGGMGELWAGVAHELGDVKKNVWVSNLERTQSGMWRVLDGRGGLLAEVDYVVVAHNGKCADRLMAKAGVPTIHRLLQCKFAPKVTAPTKMHLSSLWMCIAVFDKPLGFPWAGAEIEQHPVLSWAGNNSKKPGLQHQGYEAWTLLSTRQFGTANKCPQEDIPAGKRAQVTDLMLQAFFQVAGLITADGHSPQPVHTFVQLWGAAVPLNVLCGEAPSVLDFDSAVGVCGDWFTSPCIEGAAESGLHLADTIAAHAALRQPPGTANGPATESTLAATEPVFSAFASHSIGDVPLDDEALERSKANAVRAVATTAVNKAPPRRERAASKSSRRGSNSKGRAQRPNTADDGSTSSQRSMRPTGKPISGGFTGGTAADGSSSQSAQSAVGTPSRSSPGGSKSRNRSNRGRGNPIHGGSTCEATERDDRHPSHGSRGGRVSRGRGGRGRGKGSTRGGRPGKQTAPARVVSTEA
eukprot:COSAG02_NODE_3918_length_6048_cov_3.708186_1_plen_591_part_00